MHDRDRQVERVLWGVLAMNLAVVAIKLTVALRTNSVAALAEMVHGMLDASANVIGLYGLSVARQPPDDGHPYGHRRFESLAALAIGVLVALGLVQVLGGIWDGLRGRASVPTVDDLSVGLLMATVVLNLTVSRYEARRGAELSSGILTADAGHTMADGLSVAVVLMSLFAVRAGWHGADLLGAVVVAALIARTALHILRENAASLADSARLDADAVRATALTVAGVRGAHKVRSRGLESHIHVDLHIQVDGTLSVRAAHDIAHAVQAAIVAGHKGVTDVVVHTEPEEAATTP